MQNATNDTRLAQQRWLFFVLLIALLLFTSSTAAQESRPPAQATGAAAQNADAAAQAPSAAVVNNRPIRIHVIGFGVDQATTQQLTAMAQAGGGRYYPAANEAELTAALGSAAGLTMNPTASSEAEKNNSLGHATQVLPSGAIAGTIDPVGDADWYQVELDQQGQLTVIVAPPPELDVHIHVLNGDGADVTGWVAPTRAGAETKAVVNIPAAGRYYLTLVDGKNDATSTTPYSLQLGFAPGDALEPNGSFGRARSIKLGEEIFASILPTGDHDHFCFELPRQGALHVSATQVAPEVDLQLRLFSGDLADLTGWLAPLRAGADNDVVIDIPGPGRYDLELCDGRDDAASPKEYHLNVTFDPGDALEPNGSLGRATPIDPDGGQLANVLPRGDQDWYVLKVDHPGAVQVLLTNVPPEVDLHFRALNADAADMTGWLAPLRAGADNEAVVDLPTPGRYYLQVTDGKNDARAAANYAITTRYARADDYEPNNSFGAARPIGLGQTVMASILPRGDVDVFSFDVTNPCTAQVSITDVPPELDLHIRIRDPDGADISGWKAPLRAGADVAEAIPLRAAGRHYLEIVDGRNDARAAAPFKLTLTVDGAAQQQP